MRQSKINRILSALLALALCAQLLPSVPVTAEEASENTEATTETVPETTQGATDPTVPETTQGATDPTIPETTQESTAPTVSETTEESGTPVLFLQSDDDPWQAIQSGKKAGESGYIFAPGVTYDGQDSLELLKSLLLAYTQDVIFSDNVLSSMSLEKGEQLILLSVTDPTVYQNTVFKPGSDSTGGNIDLSGALGNEELQITFQGLGSASTPFQGNFQGALPALQQGVRCSILWTIRRQRFRIM